MIKKEKVKYPAIPARTEEEDVVYCDKCGNKLFGMDRNKRIEQYNGYDIYKEDKYTYYSYYDFCEDCVESFLMPLIQKNLKKEPNKREDRESYWD